MKKLIFILFCTLLSSCAQDMYVKYQSEATNPGKIVIQPEKPTSKTYISINDQMVVEKKSVKSVTIDNIPTGNHNIHYYSKYIWYTKDLDTQFTVNITANKEHNQSIDVPPYNAGFWVLNGVAIILPTLVLISTFRRVNSLQ